MREYIIYREMGHRSLFGEPCISEFTELQARLISTTHLYDVIRSGPGSDDKIPADVLPYPLSMQEWYNDYKAKQKQERERQSRGTNDPGKKSKKRSPKSAYANETDVQALAIWSMSQKAGEDGWQPTQEDRGSS